MPEESQRDFFNSVTDVAGSRESWFRDTYVDQRDVAR